MSARRWSLCLVVMLTLLLGMVTVAQAANQIVIVKSEYTQKYYTKIGGSFSAYWSSVEKIMQRAGYEGKYDTLTDADVEDGKLSVDTWKLLILPVNNCMSKKEAEQIIKYVKAGGALIANYNVGMRLENANDSINFLLADVTGVDRAPEFSSGVNPNYTNMQATDVYHPFFAGLPKTLPFLKHYTVLTMPRPEVKTLARWFNDAGVQSNVERKSGAIYQIGRVVYNGGDIWDPDKSLDTPELNLLIKNMIDELLSGRVAMALPPARKLDDGFYIKGRYAVRALIEKQKIVQGEGSINSGFPGSDQDTYFGNSMLILVPRYVKGNVEAGAEVWSRVYVDRPQLAEAQITAGAPVTVPTIQTAWTKINTKEVLVTAALRPDGGYEPIGDLKMVGSSDPLGLVSPNVVTNTNWSSNIKAHIKNLKGWTGLLGFGVQQGGWPGLNGAAWVPWTDNTMLYLREDFLKFGKSRLEVGLTYNQRRLDGWGPTWDADGAGPIPAVNMASWMAASEVGSPDFKLKTPYGNLVYQYAGSNQEWSASPGNTMGPAQPNISGNATLVAIERVPVGGLKFSSEVRTMSSDFRNYSWMGAQDTDNLAALLKTKYDNTGWTDDPTTKRSYYDSIMYFADQAKADEAISQWIKYRGNRVLKSQLSGDLVKGIAGLDANYEGVIRLADASKVFDGGKVELSAKKPIGIFTPRLSVEREDGTEYRWAAYDEKLTWAKVVGGTQTTVDNHVRDYLVDNTIRKAEADYSVSPKVSGKVGFTSTSLDEFRAEVKDSSTIKPAQVWIVKAPGRNVEEESTNLHADVKVILSPQTNVTTGVDFYYADRLTSTEDASLAPGHKTSLLSKIGHNFSDKMWGTGAIKTVRLEDGTAENSAYADLTRQLTKNINGRAVFLADGEGGKNILYGQLGYSLPIGSTTGLYLKWRRTTNHATYARTDNTYLSLTHIVGNAQITASYGKVPFDTTFTDYGNPWDWMVGGTSLSADTATIDFKITF